MQPKVIAALSDPDAPTSWKAGRGGVRHVPSIRSRLYANTRTTASGCIVKVTYSGDSYPVISIASVTVQASRVVFYLAHGYEPMVVRHSCDNPACINVEHLLGGTYQDNTQDALDRGRLHGVKKDECLNGHALTEDNRYGGTGACKECARERARRRYAESRLTT